MSSPSALLLEDLTGDVYPELVTANYMDSSVSVFIGNSGGVFSGPKNTTVGNQVLALAAGDVNGDGKKDLAALSYSGHSVSVLKGAGDGSFTAIEMHLQRRAEILGQWRLLISMATASRIWWWSARGMTALASTSAMAAVGLSFRNTSPPARRPTAWSSRI
jgi:hypothetical protein